ncbi:CMP-binding protein [Clostridium botulinum]|nr:CMP-binding protein [Clostridium botulinum]
MAKNCFIKEIMEESIINEPVSITGLINRIKTKNTKAGELLSVSIKDLSFNDPIECVSFNNIDKLREIFKEGMVVNVCGNINEFNKRKSINITNINPTNIPKENFIERYNIPKSMIKQFKQWVNEMKSPYNDFASYVFNNTWNQFLTAPAAERFHQNKLGGLFIHTFGVCLNMYNILTNYVVHPFYQPMNKINKDRLMLIAMMHDIDKIYEYEYDDGYIKRKDTLLSHNISFITKIMFINDKIENKLSNEDIEIITNAILSHNGEYGVFQMKTIEDILLHSCDMIDAKIYQNQDRGLLGF